MERHQVVLYVGALATGALSGLLVPPIADPAAHAVSPVLALLLYVTFLGVPFARIGSSLRDTRFLATLGIVNFLVVPPIAWLLSRLVADERALLAGVLFVLLAPCVDYVIVFAGLAGGSADRLLAAAPLLMLAQIVLLPLYLRVFLGSEIAFAIEPEPFIEALVLLILVPMAFAAATQFLSARSSWGRAFERRALGTMVPLMMLTLASVVASQITGVGAHLDALLRAIVVYAAFVIVMVPIGMLAGRAARTDPAADARSSSAESRAIRWSSCRWPSRSPRVSSSPRSRSSPRRSSNSSRWSSWFAWCRGL
jgi:ACR3 family arsenite efflux pump ArsB